MFLLHLELPLSYVPANQISRVNWFRTMCILLINSHKLSETRSSVSEILYVLIIVIAFLSENLDFTPAVFVLG